MRVGARLTVQPLLDDGGAVLVRSRHGEEEYEERLLPREVDDYGFAADAARPGEFKAARLTEVEQAGARLRELAGRRKPGEAAFGGRFAALDAVAGTGAGASPAAADAAGKVIPMPRRGREIEVRSGPAAAVLTLADAGRYVRGRLGEAWDPALFEELAGRWPRGAAAAELDGWLAELREAVHDAPA